jgi:RNA polymerase sigma-70 factor (ECF subfamily)
MADTPSNLSTSVTLLGRLGLQPNDESAWQEFVARYTPLLQGWCRRCGLQATDAEDVTQNILLRLAGQLRRYDYRPSGSFRGWLRTVARGAWCDFLVVGQKPGAAGTGESAVQQLLNNVEAQDDLVAQLDAEATRELLRAAVEQVRPNVQQSTWDAFQLQAIEGLSGAEVAERLQLSVGAVYMARCRVQKMLRDEIARLDSAECLASA